MASGQRTASSAIDHPTLGQATAIYDDRARTRWNVLFGLGLVVLGISGIFMGSGDLAAGNSILGWAYVGGSIFLGLWGIRGAFQAARRLRNPISLVIGRRGFEYSDGPGPISWDEVATISDPSSPAGQPRMLRVQLNDPEDYVVRHALSPLSRLMLRINHDDLLLGHDTIMPVVEAESLMRRQLAEFRRAGSAPAGGPASSPVRTAPRGRRRSRKR